VIAGLEIVLKKKQKQKQKTNWLKVVEKKTKEGSNQNIT